MSNFSHYVRSHLLSHLHARSMCQGSTIILGMCALFGAATAIAVLITHLTPTV